MAEGPIEGREAIRAMFAAGFAATEMVCIPENLFKDGDWAILEWRDPKGLRGYGSSTSSMGGSRSSEAIGTSCRFSSCTDYSGPRTRPEILPRGKASSTRQVPVGSRPGPKPIGSPSRRMSALCPKMANGGRSISVHRKWLAMLLS